MANQERAKRLWQKSKDFFQNLNLFPSIPPSNVENELRNQRISTRLFIFLFILSFIVLLLYTSLIGVTKIINVKTPTLAQYSQLYSIHSQSLTCPCTTTLINYEKFVHIEYTLHQLCTSIFVTNNWISYLHTQNSGTTLFRDDFRSTGPFAFQSLSMFCKLINSTISDSLRRFYSSEYVSTSLTPLQLLETQVEASIDQLRMSTASTFLLFLSTIRGTTQGNGLLSAQQSNFELFLRNGSNLISDRALIYSGCNCRLSATCIEQFAIYNNPNTTRLFTVPGFYIGCYVIESLLQSTLQCLYNQTCINRIQFYLSLSSFMNVKALDSSLSSQYLENSTIQTLIDNLMIEEWNWTYMYDKYYNECQPTQCTYTLETRKNVIHIVTTLFGLVGGLIIILQFVVPRLVTFITYCIRKWKRRVVPNMPMVET